MKQQDQWWIIEQYLAEEDAWYGVGMVANTQEGAEREAEDHEEILDEGDEFRVTKVKRA